MIARITKKIAGEGEEESGGVEPHEAALLPLVINYVKGVKECRYSGIRASQGDEETHMKATPSVSFPCRATSVI